MRNRVTNVRLSLKFMNTYLEIENNNRECVDNGFGFIILINV